MALSNRFAAMGEYSRSPVARDRNYGGLAAWAAAKVREPIPKDPDDLWIRIRVLAERIPQQTDLYVTRLAPYLLQTPDVVDNICDHLAPYLEDERADAVQRQISAALQTVMPQFAMTDVAMPQVNQWRIDNGYPPPKKTNGPPPTPAMGGQGT